MPMAPGRLYRDYSDEDVSSAIPPRRTPSLQRTREPTGSPRTVISIPQEEDEDNEAARVREHAKHQDFAREDSSEAEAESSIDEYYGAGIARTTDDNGVVPYHASNEPVLTEDQVSLSPHDSAAPSTSATYPPDIKDINKRRFLAPSVASGSRVSHDDRQSSDKSAVSKMPEFFSQSVFHSVLHNPTIAHQLLKFSQTRLCGENLEFLARVNKYHILLDEVSKAIHEIHTDFISPTAPAQINLDERLLVRVHNEMKSSLSSTIPAMESIFVDAQADIERLVYTDIYPKFVRRQMSMSAARALGGDRGRYAGLGDCFVLTDPTKADNPIVYATDGFVKVTGYQRNEIIPRNCRFLQGRGTDRSAVKRLKTAIDKREETVELLLNHKKDGEPFWNLLYMTPLFDGHGNLAFFLGGQINCSTTIHSTSDVLRILAYSKDGPQEEEGQATRSATMSPVAPMKPSRRSILSAFRSNSKQQIQPRASAGMENTLLDRIEDMPLKNQMNTFYTAYSNYIIINYSTFLITFVSAGIIDLLFPIKAKTAYHAQAVGADVFKFLANHSTGSLSWDFKSAIKGALKSGQPISIDLKLCAKPYMGFERFALHWTPLKDEVGAVTWVVLTLGNENRA